MILVITAFIENIQHDQQTGGQPRRQSKNIDKGEYFVPGQIPECDLYIAPEHMRRFRVIVHQQKCQGLNYLPVNRLVFQGHPPTVRI
jgi:hypothetical protein